jgi:hypothetical protein
MIPLCSRFDSRTFAPGILPIIPVNRTGQLPPSDGKHFVFLPNVGIGRFRRHSLALGGFGAAFECFEGKD